MKTPYTLVFGREPLEAIPRNVQKDEVLNAFQVLGYYTSKYNGDYKKAIPEFKSYLEDYVYEKVLSEMSVLHSPSLMKTCYKISCKKLLSLH